MNLVKLWTIAALAILTASGVPALAREHLDNGNFERGPAGGLPDGWQINGAAGLGGKFTYVKDSSGARSGDRYLALENGPGKSEMALMTPSFAIRQGSYRIKMSAKGAGAFTAYLYQYDAGGNFVSSAPFGSTATPEWKDYQWDYSPAASIARVTFALHAAGKISFDECSFAGIQVDAGPSEDLSKTRHIFTIPPVTEAPSVDGKFTAGEWAKAAATTGFTVNDKHLASTVQPVVYSCYDDSSLYIAVVSPIPAGKTLAANVRGIGGAVWDDDDVELLLQPDLPDGTVFHLLASPGGGFSGFRDERPYNQNLFYKTEMTSKTWVAEFKLPFDALGTSRPADGAVWGVNFCRGQVNPRVWTSWSPAVSFTDVSTFGRLRFGGNGAFARVTSLGSISSGNVVLAGQVDGVDKPVNFTAGAGPNDLIKKDKVDATNIMFVGKPDAEILGATTKILETSGGLAFEKSVDRKESRLIWDVAEAEGSPIQRHFVDFVPLPPLVLELDCSPKVGTLKALLSTTGLRESHSGLKGTVRLVSRKTGKPVITKEAKFDGDKGVAVFALKSIPVGDYVLEASVLNRAGKRTTVSLPFSNAGPVPAGYAKAGFQPEVPAPWTPVQVKGSAVNVWGRAITFGKDGLPASVVSAGQKLLASPARFRAYSKGAELTPTSGRSSVKRVSAGAAESESSVGFPGLSVRTKSRTEFDGCIRVDLDVKAAKNGPESLVLEIPFNGKIVDLIHANLLGYEPTWSGSIPAGEGAVWTHDFAPVIWLGNTRAGMCWFAESQEGWGLASPGSKDTHTQEIVRDGDTITLRVYLSRAQFKPGAGHHIVFGLQPTPVKAIPKNWRMTRMGSGNPYLSDPDRRDSFIPEPGSKWWGWPEPFSQEEYDQRMADVKSGKIKVRADMMPFSPQVYEEARKTIHDAGARLIWYASCNELANNSPWFSTYGKDWSLTYGVAGREFPDDPWGNASAVCPVSKFQDLYVGTMQMAMKKYDFDGAYIDLFYPWRCANPAHGCGFIDDDGKRQGEYCIWGMREELKRLYRVVHARRNGYIMGHISASYLPPVHGFVDTAVDGEQFQTHFTVAGGLDYHDVLPLDKCRAEVSGRQWGWIPMWLPQFWVKVARPTSRQMLSLVLLHDCLVWPAYMDSAEYHLANATLVKMGFADFEFVGYYDSPSPARADSSDVYISAYRNPVGKAGRAILIVTNHGVGSGKFTIEPNVEALGLSNNWSALGCPDMTTRKALTRSGDAFRIELAGKDFAIVSLESN